ncbi:hypothetical protein BDDG_03422 [Blastomyces dermatitidis ATCC 18188]|uniref:Uncharacterized protein n=1 Tax=Ajellomyces dermatitidis (strain ATCC 18188 / CBS 674.68) TaxID=653446 RepID=F2TB68_AJEDA|nr:hypothetical protein BDDG_03422 [Blastomyces dermatitidis ATCC 18188]
MVRDIFFQAYGVQTPSGAPAEHIKDVMIAGHQAGYRSCSCRKKTDQTSSKAGSASATSSLTCRHIPRANITLQQQLIYHHILPTSVSTVPHSVTKFLNLKHEISGSKQMAGYVPRTGSDHRILLVAGDNASYLYLAVGTHVHGHPRTLYIHKKYNPGTPGSHNSILAASASPERPQVCRLITSLLLARKRLHKSFFSNPYSVHQTSDTDWAVSYQPAQ